MSYILYTDIHINHYLEYVQKVEQNALQVANTHPETAAHDRLYQRASNWLGAQLGRLRRGLRRAVMAAAPGEHPAR